MIGNPRAKGTTRVFPKMDRGLPKRVYSNNKRKLSSDDPFIARILGQNGAQHQLPDANPRHLMGNLHQPSTSAVGVSIDKIYSLKIVPFLTELLNIIIQQARVQQRVTNELPAKSQKRDTNSSADAAFFPNRQISHLRRQQQQLLPVNVNHFKQLKFF